MGKHFLREGVPALSLEEAQKKFVIEIGDDLHQCTSYQYIHRDGRDFDCDCNGLM